jgi:syntaxin 1B/2/3
MKDRFSDLAKLVPNDQNKDDRDLESGGSENPDMSGFFAEIGAVKESMAIIRRGIQQLEELYSRQVAGIGKDQTTQDEITAVNDKITAEQRKVRAALQRMAEENKSAPPGATETRMRINMHGTITRKFLSLMQEYEELQTKYKNKIRETVKRQMQIVNPEAKPEEIDKALDEGADASHIFADQILDARHQAAKDALSYIQNKHADILRIEESIMELHRLFQDMAILVETQSEIIDQIEYNVSVTNDAIIKGNDQLRKANKYQQSSRKKMCCIIVIVLAVLGFLLWPIISFSSGD